MEAVIRMELVTPTQTGLVAETKRFCVVSFRCRVLLRILRKSFARVVESSGLKLSRSDARGQKCYFAEDVNS